MSFTAGAAFRGSYRIPLISVLPSVHKKHPLLIEVQDQRSETIVRSFKSKRRAWESNIYVVCIPSNVLKRPNRAAIKFKNKCPENQVGVKI